MKLLYIYNLYQQAGGENQWFGSEPELLRSRGHDVIVYQRDNAEISHWPRWRQAALLWQASWSQASYEAVRNILRRERPDLAHAYNTLALITPAVYYACREQGVPVVQTLYNYRLLCPAGVLLRDRHICEACVQHSLWRGVAYRCYRQSRLQTAALAWMLYSHRRRGTWSGVVNLYLVPTEFMRHKLAAGGLPADRIVVKPNYHDPDPGLRPMSDGSVIYVGRLSAEKGLRTLLAAWQQLRHPPRLRILGDGPLYPELNRAAACHPELRIELLGRCSHQQVIACLRKAAFLVVPSEWYEGFPHVVLEAYACGVPLVASRIGTLSDVVQDGVTGVLFQPGQASDLAAKVDWLASHAEEGLRMGRRARREYETNYTAERNYQRLMAIYQRVLASTREQTAADIEPGAAGGIPASSQPAQASGLPAGA